MSTFSHYTSRQCLLSRAEENLNHQLMVTGEQDISKTCYLCGTWNSDLGGDVLHCSGCRPSTNRNRNVACGNLLTYVTEGV
eukprot:89361-Rhodomonas_salina.1